MSAPNHSSPITFNIGQLILNTNNCNCSHSSSTCRSCSRMLPPNIGTPQRNTATATHGAASDAVSNAVSDAVSDPPAVSPIQYHAAGNTNHVDAISIDSSPLQAPNDELAGLFASLRLNDDDSETVHHEAPADVHDGNEPEESEDANRTPIGNRFFASPRLNDNSGRADNTALADANDENEPGSDANDDYVTTRFEGLFMRFPRNSGPDYTFVEFLPPAEIDNPSPPGSFPRHPNASVYGDNHDPSRHEAPAGTPAPPSYTGLFHDANTLRHTAQDIGNSNHARPQPEDQIAGPSNYAARANQLDNIIREPANRKKVKHYVVTRGFDVGVFSDWHYVQSVTSGCSHSCYEGFTSKDEANAVYAKALDENRVRHYY